MKKEEVPRGSAKRKCQEEVPRGSTNPYDRRKKTLRLIYKSYFSFILSGGSSYYIFFVPRE